LGLVILCESFGGVAIVGNPAPPFETDAIICGEFKTVKLSDYEGKWLVILFYPLDFTFVCPTEILSFNDRLKEFQDINTEVVAISVDSKFSHYAWTNVDRKKGGLGPIQIPLLADFPKTIAQDYEVLYKDTGHTLRGLYIIDPKQIVRHVTLNDLDVGRSVDEVLRVVQAFQYAEKHGQVCPANWTPGKATISPNPKDSLKYFEENL